MIEALQDTPVKVPRFHGYHDDLDWLLMEWVQGDELLTAVDDREQQRALFEEYLDGIVALHALDPAQLDLPPEMAVPADPARVLTTSLRMAIGVFRAGGAGDPEPLLDLGIRWAESHVPPAPTRQPLRGRHRSRPVHLRRHRRAAMFDLELAHVGDPYEDLGLMRMREMCYPIGDLPAYLEFYASRAGIELDVDALHYWTVVGMLTGPLMMRHRIQQPDPLLPDQVPIYSWDPIYRRGLAEALMEVHGIVPDWPAHPTPVETPRTRLHELLVGQLEQHYLPAAADPAEEFRLRGTAALAATLARADSVAAELDRDVLDELGTVLGARPASRTEGLAALSAAIERDPDHDLERRLRVLHRMYVRDEYVFEPIQRSMGFTSNRPLARLDGVAVDGWSPYPA